MLNREHPDTIELDKNLNIVPRENSEYKNYNKIF